MLLRLGRSNYPAKSVLDDGLRTFALADADYDGNVQAGQASRMGITKINVLTQFNQVINHIRP